MYTDFRLTTFPWKWPGLSGNRAPDFLVTKLPRCPRSQHRNRLNLTRNCTGLKSRPVVKRKVSAEEKVSSRPKPTPIKRNSFVQIFSVTRMHFSFLTWSGTSLGSGLKARAWRLGLEGKGLKARAWKLGLKVSLYSIRHGRVKLEPASSKDLITERGPTLMA